MSAMQQKSSSTFDFKIKLTFLICLIKTGLVYCKYWRAAFLKELPEAQLPQIINNFLYEIQARTN